MQAKEWTVDIHITEDHDNTHATAVLSRRGTTELTGRGDARRNPNDRAIPEIGEELAVSRALEDLSVRLNAVASQDIVQLAGPVEA